MNVTDIPYGVMTVMMEVMSIGDVGVRNEPTAEENFPCSTYLNEISVSFFIATI